MLILNIYLRPEQQDLLLEYDEDDYALDEEDRINEIIERSGNHWLWQCWENYKSARNDTCKYKIIP